MPTKSIVVGALWMASASLGMAVLVGLVKAASVLLPPLEIIWFQSLFGIVVMAPFVWKSGVRPKHPWWQLVCGLTSTGGYLFYFTGLKFAPMVDVVLATNTAPLWVPIGVWAFFRERIGGWVWAGILVGFIGILVILRPGLAGFNPWVFLPLITGLLIALLFIGMGQVAKDDGPYLTLFWISVIAAIGTLPSTWMHWVTPTGWFWLLLLGVGVANSYLQLARVWSFERGPASLMSPIYYLTVPLSGIVGWIVWGHVPDWLFYVGAVLVIGGGIWTIAAGGRQRELRANK